MSDGKNDNNQNIEKITQSFLALLSWEDRYNKIIQMGRALPALDEKFKTEDFKIKGCQSQVWLGVQRSSDGRLIFSAGSDALIVKGLVALLLVAYSGRTPADILKLEPTFIKDIGLDGHLSPSRTNGLFSMIKQIKYYAIAYSAI